MKRYVVVTLVISVCTSCAFATINYGDFNGVTVTYKNVSENDEGLFEKPTVSGDALLFSPTAFGIESAGAGGFDMLDGTLQMIIKAKPAKFIDTIRMTEAGDYTLFGSGTAGTSATVNASIFFRITEVDFVDLLSPLEVYTHLAFSPSDGSYNLVDEGFSVAEIWDGGIDFGVTLALQSIGNTGMATEVYVSMDNTLVTTSEVGTQAFIKKKVIDGVGITVVPEPATICLLGLGGLVLLRKRRA